MILKDWRVAEAMHHIQNPARPGIVVWHNGKRYGGFSSREHAEFFILQAELVGAEIDAETYRRPE